MASVNTNYRVLDALKLFKTAPRTRPELAELLDARSDTAGLWVKQLEMKGFIRMKGHRPTRQGTARPAIEWEYIKEE